MIKRNDSNISYYIKSGNTTAKMPTSLQNFSVYSVVVIGVISLNDV